jgi:hypothetical protein
MEGPMTAQSLAKEQLELYQRYSGIAREATDFEIRAAYESLALQALLRAAKLDPAASGERKRNQSVAATCADSR